jgi:sugar phosphate isomerase/epimerase
MLIPGLVSVTFRSLSTSEVIDLMKRAGLEAVEWGGDVHVPPGDVARAREVGQATRDAGLMVAAYGSYYRLGGGEMNKVPFEDVLASAAALGAPTIRVWAGVKGSADTTPEERAAVVADARRVAHLAGRKGITICLEYHANTLTDDDQSARRLLVELDHPNIDFLWQPANGESIEANVARLMAIMPRLRNVHVFHWFPVGERQPLADGALRWRTYLDLVRDSGRDVDFLLEFVLNDSTEQLIADAKTLRGWLNSF